MDRDRLIAWVGTRFLPHEGEVRGWLGRMLSAPSDVDDVIQEVYCRVWNLDTHESITNPRAYFFHVARNIVRDDLRRAKVVRFTHLAEVDDDTLAHAGPSPEQSAWSRDELRHVLSMMEKLSPRCRRIFFMRKIEGLSLKEISSRLGLSQTVVQNEVSRGLKRLLQVLEEDRRATGRAPTRPLVGKDFRRG